MGIHDRDYYRDESQPRGFQLGGGDMALVTKLVIVNAVLFFANIFTPVVSIPALINGDARELPVSEIKDPNVVREANQNAHGTQRWLTRTLSIQADVTTKPWLWWKFLTYGFAHADVWHLIGNMFGLWIFGRAIEGRYGSREFLFFYLAAVVLGSIVWIARVHFGAGMGGMLLGASGGATAVVLLYCLLYPHHTILLMMVLPVPAWMLGCLIILGNIFGHGGPGIAYDVHLVGAAFAGCYFYFGWNLSRHVPRFGWGGGLRKSVKSLVTPKPRLKVHHPEADYTKLDAEADRVLGKLHSEGEASLNERERKVLADYSRRMKQKHR